MVLEHSESTETLRPVFFDVAKYMMAANAITKPLYSKLFHVTCVAHLLVHLVAQVCYESQISPKRC